MAWEYHATPEAVGELLRGGGEFNEPERILSDLTTEQACQTPPGSPYSIAQVVAHLHYWQEAQIMNIQGEPLPRPAHLDDTFAAPEPAEWEALKSAFLAGIEAVGTLAREKAAVTSPDRDDTSIPYDLAESALHNAYHLGQVVLLRRIMGFWPPAEGDANDY